MTGLTILLWFMNGFQWRTSLIAAGVIVAYEIIEKVISIAIRKIKQKSNQRVDPTVKTPVESGND